MATPFASVSVPAKERESFVENRARVEEFSGLAFSDLIRRYMEGELLESSDLSQVLSREALKSGKKYILVRL